MRKRSKDCIRCPWYGSVDADDGNRMLAVIACWVLKVDKSLTADEHTHTHTCPHVTQPRDLPLEVCLPEEGQADQKLESIFHTKRTNKNPAPPEESKRGRRRRWE